MRENLQEEAIIDKDNPRNSVLPIRVNPRKGGAVVCGQDEYDASASLPAYETVDSYIKAMTNLYQDQKSLHSEMKNEEHPRSSGVRTLMEVYLRRSAKNKRTIDVSNLVTDLGSETGILREVMRSAWIHRYPKPEKGNKTKTRIGIGLRERLFASWGHFLMTRAENMRMATLPDIRPYSFDNEGATRGGGQFILGIVLTMLQGKTNREGQTRETCMIRNDDVEICPVGSLAFHFLERWMVCF